MSAVFSPANFFFFLYIFRVFCVYVPLPPLRGQHTVLCHPRWLPTLGLTEFAVCWGEAGFEPRTTDLQSGALPLSHLSSELSHLSSKLSHLSSKIEPPLLQQTAALLNVSRFQPSKVMPYLMPAIGNPKPKLSWLM
jgi:hypothetical protein